MAVAGYDPIFAPLDAANLHDQGLLGPMPTHGSRLRRCHKRRLNRSSDEEYGDVPLNIRHDSPQAADAFAAIPESLISHETVLYVGLSEATATKEWDDWYHWPSFGPRREVDPDNGLPQITVLDFITARLEFYTDIWEDDDAKWVATMDDCGLSAATQEVIMDDRFKTIRMSNSCIFWVKYTIEMRYAGLEEIQRASREREMQIQRAASRPGGGSRSGGASRELGDAGQGQHRGRTNGSSQRTRSVSGLQQAYTAGISSDFWNSDAAKRVRDNPDCIMLFKGTHLSRIRNLFGDDGRVKDIESLVSQPPSDFSGSRSCYYFTADYNVAEFHAAYAKRRAKYESIIMVTLAVRKQVMDELEEPDVYRLYWSPRWRQLVWRSKLCKPLPQPLRKYRDAILLIGHISTGAEGKFKAMETWEALTNDFLLRVPATSNNVAVQYVFNGEEEGREFLVEHGNFVVFRFSDGNVRDLLRRYGSIE